MMKRFRSNPSRAAILSCALGALCAATPALAEDLMQVYREAQQNDPTLAGALALCLAAADREFAEMYRSFGSTLDRGSLWAGLFDLRENLLGRTLEDLRALAAG